MRSEPGMTSLTTRPATPASRAEAVVVPLPATAARSAIRIAAPDRANGASVTSIRSRARIRGLPPVAVAAHGLMPPDVLCELERLLQEQVDAHLIEIERTGGDAPRSTALVRRSLVLLMRLRRSD